MRRLAFLFFLAFLLVCSSQYVLGNDEKVIIAILDSGINYQHIPGINMWDGSDYCLDENGNGIPEGCNHGYDFVDTEFDPRNDPIDDVPQSHYDCYYSHGTSIAKIVYDHINLRDNSYSSNIEVMSVRIQTAYPDGSGYGLPSWKVNGIRFAKNNGAKIILVASGSDGSDDSENDAITAFVKEADNGKGGLFITSAGNGGRNIDNDPYYPLAIIILTLFL